MALRSPCWRNYPCTGYRVGTAAVYLSTGTAGAEEECTACSVVPVCLAVTTRCAVRAETVMSAMAQRVLVSTQ